MTRRSGGRWFRMYEAILENPKVDRLPGETYKGWVKLCALASRHGGDLPCLEDIAYGLRMNEQDTKQLLEALEKVGLVDKRATKVRMHDWDEHQYQSDVSTERVKRHRQAKRNAAATPTQRDETVSVTPPETDTDTETESETEAEEETPSLRSAPDPVDEFVQSVLEGVEPPKAKTNGHAKAAIALDTDAAFDAFNEAAKRAGWPECQARSKSRTALIKRRMEAVGGFAGWRAALEKAEASDFLCGRAPSQPGRQPFIANIDFLLQESSFIKLMEGRYDNRTSAAQPASPIRAAARAVADSFER